MFPWACRPVPWQRFPTLGLLTVGGTVPPDPLFAGLMTTVLAYTTGSDVNTALGLAVPFALIGQWIGTATNTLYAGFLPGVDRDAAAGNERGVARRMYTGWFIYAFLFALAAFLSVYAFQSGISTFVASFPEWLVHGFEVAGGLIPSYVSFAFPETLVAAGNVSIQGIFDSIMPNILPLGFVFLLYWLFKKKNVNTMKLILLVIVFSVALSALGIM